MKTLNVYMYLGEDEKNKNLCVSAIRDDGGVSYNKSMTLGDMDYEDAAAYTFGVVMRFITPFIRDGNQVRFFASQDKLIKAFDGNTISKYGTVEKVEDNPAEKFDKDAVDMETRMVRDLKTARRLADFSFGSMFGRGRTPMFGFSMPSFPLRPFTYIDEFLPRPFRELDFSGRIPEDKPEEKSTESADKTESKSEVKTETMETQAETNVEAEEKVPEAKTEENKSNDQTPDEWFASLSEEDKMTYIKKFMGMMD